jgi:guanylate kinase
MNTKEYLSSSDKLLLIIGPSAVGKSSVATELEKAGIIELTPTWTDRPKRQDEVGAEHMYVSPSVLDAQAAKGYFVHPPLTFFGLPYRYAMPRILRPAAGKISCVLARAHTVPLFRKYYSNLVIYQIEAPRDRVAQYLNVRSQTGSPLGTRLNDYEKEISIGRDYADRVFENHEFETTLQQLIDEINDDFGVGNH